MDLQHGISSLCSFRIRKQTIALRRQFFQHGLQPPAQLSSSGCKDWVWLLCMLKSHPWYQAGIVTIKWWYCFFLLSAKRLDSLSVSWEFWYVLPAVSVPLCSCQGHDFIEQCDIPDNTTLKITLALTWAASAFWCTSGWFGVALFATCPYSDRGGNGAAAVSTDRRQVLHAKAP